MSFPTSKIELHQWANTILLGVVGFFVVETYRTIQTSAETLNKHETRVTVLEVSDKRHETQLNIMTGRIETLRKYNITV